MGTSSLGEWGGSQFTNLFKEKRRSEVMRIGTINLQSHHKYNITQ